jgi:hypothetical protein
MSTGQDSREPTGKIAIFQVMGSDEDFASNAIRLWMSIADAAEKQPGKLRHLFLDIGGHRDAAGELDAEALLLLDEFLKKVLMPYLDEAQTPLGLIRNSAGQQDPPRQIPLGDSSDEAVAKLAEFARSQRDSPDELSKEP